MAGYRGPSEQVRGQASPGMTTAGVADLTISGFAMKLPTKPSDTTLDRRDLVKVTAATAAGVLSASLAAPAAIAQEAKIEAQEHWAMKGAVKLYLYRKRQV